MILTEQSHSHFWDNPPRLAGCRSSRPQQALRAFHQILSRKSHLFRSMLRTGPEKEEIWPQRQPPLPLPKCHPAK